MPGLNGYDTCRRMRADRTRRHAKIIMVSAKAMLSERLQGYEAGADDYITKPFDEDELIAKVRTFLRLTSLEEVDQLKTDVLRLLNHETRTPLSHIIPVIEMILEDDAMDPHERKAWLIRVRDAAGRLGQLFDKVIRLTAMKSGTWTFNFAPADLSAVVREVLTEASVRAAEREIVITQTLSQSAPASLDSTQIKCVIAALIDNAIRFSPPGTAVTVAVSHDEGVVRPDYRRPGSRRRRRTPAAHLRRVH
ncbi:MAG TPA: response regulator [Candidatus Binataceae bacterium]|nr:response regulator [Candidatus Binataceae bacterium]